MSTLHIVWELELKYLSCWWPLWQLVTGRSCLDQNTATNDGSIKVLFYFVWGIFSNYLVCVAGVTGVPVSFFRQYFFLIFYHFQLNFAVFQWSINWFISIKFLGRVAGVVAWAKSRQEGVVSVFLSENRNFICARNIFPWINKINPFTESQNFPKLLLLLWLPFLTFNEVKPRCNTCCLVMGYKALK